MKNTYIFICSYNRLNPLKELYSSLIDREYYNIVILDNSSTYQPLLDWYNTLERGEVFYCGGNYGPEVLSAMREHNDIFKSKYNHILAQQYFVYTDSDVIPIKDAPENFIDDLVEMAKKYNIPKIGLSLKIDDLPDSFLLKEKVISHESVFFNYKREEWIEDEKCTLYRAPVDTTFSINCPGHVGGYDYNAYRSGGNYFARHAPWYFDSNNLPQEERYYLQTIVGNRPHWSNELKNIVNVNSNS